MMERVTLPPRLPSLNVLRQCCGQNEAIWINFFNRTEMQNSLTTIIKKHFSLDTDSILNIISIRTASDMGRKWLALTSLVFGEIQTRMPNRRTFCNPESYRHKENYSALLYLVFCAKSGLLPQPANLVVWKKAYQYYNITESFERYLEGDGAMRYKSAYLVGDRLDMFISRNWEIPVNVVRSTLN